MKQKRQARKTETSRSNKSVEPVVPLAASPLQQRILNIFRDALASTTTNEDLVGTIQQVKQHLYNRDFAQAFGPQEYLDAYAVRWSAARSLGYLQILQDITPLVLEAQRTSRTCASVPTEQRTVTSATESASPGTSTALPLHSALHRSLQIDPPPDYAPADGPPGYEHPPVYGSNNGPPHSSGSNDTSGLHVTCLGGGAGAELIACAAWLRSQTDNEDDITDDTTAEPDAPSLDVTCIDIADWSSVTTNLTTAVYASPSLSAYASAAARATNAPLLPTGAMRACFIREDLLEADPDRLRAQIGPADLITIMFTLNELYSTSVARTQRLLFELTVATRPGTLLLVVDSPGTYSTVSLNGAEKRYPMQWLLDHTLLDMSRNTRLLARAAHWEKLVSDESRWFRMPKGLKYPIELENMRYQIHVYKRLAVPEEAAVAGPSVSVPRR